MDQIVVDLILLLNIILCVISFFFEKGLLTYYFLFISFVLLLLFMCFSLSPDLTYHNALEVALFVSTFNFCSIFLSVITRSLNILAGNRIMVQVQRSSAILNSAKNNVPRRYNVICFFSIVGVIVCLLIPYNFNILTLAHARWNNLNVNFHGNAVFFNNMMMFFLIVVGSYIQMGSQYKLDRYIISVIVFLEISVFLLLKTKIYLLFLIIPLIVLIFESKNRLKFVPKMLSITLLAFFLYQLTRYIRYYGFVIEPDKFFHLITSPIESGIINSLFLVFNYFKFNSSFLLGDSYLRLLFPIYHFFSVMKPQNPIYLYANIGGTGGLTAALRGSSDPTIYGDSFANFGYYSSIIIPFFYVILLRIIDRISNQRNLYVKNMVLLATIVGIAIIARGSVYFGMLMICRGLVMLVLFLVFLKLQDSMRILLARQRFSD